MRTNYPIASLGGHVRQVSKRNKEKADIEVFSVTNSEGFTRSSDYFSKEVFSKDVSNYKVVRRGQFAYNPSRINVGSIDYLKPAETALVSPLYIVFETNAGLSPDYLLRYMKGDWGNAQIRANTEGAVRDSLKYKGLENIKIPLPPLDDQKRIAHLLGKVEGLIARRKQHLQQLDDLLKSVFMEMFGDPVRNEKGWEPVELPKLCEAIIDCPHSTPVYSDEKTGYYCVRSGDIIDGYLDLSKTLHVGRDVYEERIKRYTPQIGDIVYSREGGRLGNAARILGAESICLGQRIMIFKANEENSAAFLWALLESRSFKTKLQGLVGGGAAPRVNIKDLKKIIVIQPPSSIQEQFSRITKRVDQIKSRYLQSLADLENLYGALSQKAFQGELDLSRIPLNQVRQDVHEEPQVEITTSFEIDFPEHIKTTLADLNAFNSSAISLKAAQEEAARFPKLDFQQLVAVRQAAEQLAALRTPLQELKQMAEISKAMEQAQAAIKSLGLGDMAAISKSSELARSLAAGIPKLDLDWLAQEGEAIRKAAEPFEAMRKAMESISLPTRELPELLRLESETAKRLHGSIPDFIDGQKQAVGLDAVDFPEHIKTTLADLNAFNYSATSLKAAQEEAARFTKLDFQQLDVVKQAAEQLAALRTPLQELKQMAEISKAMEQAQTAIESLDIGHMAAIRNSAELARSIAASIPKIDMGWLEQESEALRKAAEPFESMRRAMESISLPPRELQELLRLQSETTRHLHSSIPDFIGWQKQAIDPDIADFDEEEPVKRLFTREDVTAIFAYAVEPLSFESLLHELGEFQSVDFVGYENIKTILFELLAEQQLKQLFDEELKLLLLSVGKKGSVQ